MCMVWEGLQREEATGQQSYASGTEEVCWQAGHKAISPLSSWTRYGKVCKQVTRQNLFFAAQQCLLDLVQII